MTAIVEVKRIGEWATRHPAGHLLVIEMPPGQLHRLMAYLEAGITAAGYVGPHSAADRVALGEIRRQMRIAPDTPENFRGPFGDGTDDASAPPSPDDYVTTGEALALLGGHPSVVSLRTWCRQRRAPGGIQFEPRKDHRGAWLLPRSVVDQHSQSRKAA